MVLAEVVFLVLCYRELQIDLAVYCYILHVKVMTMLMDCCNVWQTVWDLVLCMLCMELGCQADGRVIALINSCCCGSYQATVICWHYFSHSLEAKVMVGGGGGVERGCCNGYASCGQPGLAPICEAIR